MPQPLLWSLFIVLTLSGATITATRSLSQNALQAVLSLGSLSSFPNQAMCSYKPMFWSITALTGWVLLFLLPTEQQMSSGKQMSPFNLCIPSTWQSICHARPSVSVCCRKATMVFLWTLLITPQSTLTEGDIGFYHLTVANIDTYSHFTPYLLMFWPQRSKSRYVVRVKHWGSLWVILVNRWSGENRELCGGWVYHPKSNSLKVFR